MHDEIAYEGPGRYYLTDGQSSISLGMCRSRRELESSASEALNAGDADWDGWRIDKDAAPKATIVKGNKVVATADTVGEAKAYAKKVGGQVLIPCATRKNGFAVTPADRKVIRAFTDHRPAESKHLSTDGHRIDGLWMGGNKIATWGGDQIHFHNLGGKAAQTVQRAISREVPKNWIAK